MFVAHCFCMEPHRTFSFTLFSHPVLWNLTNNLSLNGVVELSAFISKIKIFSATHNNIYVNQYICAATPLPTSTSSSSSSFYTPSSPSSPSSSWKSSSPSFKPSCHSSPSSHIHFVIYIPKMNYTNQIFENGPIIRSSGPLPPSTIRYDYPPSQHRCNHHQTYNMTSNDEATGLTSSKSP